MIRRLAVILVMCASARAQFSVPASDDSLATPTAANYWNFVPTLYADPAGSGTACTALAPCSLQYAFNTKAAPGDVIQAADGTYDTAASCWHFTQSGTSLLPVVATCKDRGQCVIQSSGTNGTGCVVETDGDYEVIDGFAITNESVTNGVYQIVYATGHHQIFSRNVIHDVQGPCDSHGGGGFQASASSGPTTYDANLIYNIFNVSCAGAGAEVQVDGGLDETTTVGSVFSNNIVTNVAGGWGLNHGNGSGAGAVTFENNLVFGCSQGGIESNEITSGPQIIENNIILDNNAYSGTYRCAVGPPFSGNLTYVTVRHNDIYGNPGGSYCNAGASGSYNNIGGDIAVDPASGTTFVSWPVPPVTSPNSANYVQKPGSPTIGAGDCSNQPTHDYSGKMRTGAATCDIGPYQN